MNIYKFDIKYENTYELISHFVSVYSKANNVKFEKIDEEDKVDKTKDGYIRPALVKVLTYYVLKGYSDETKELILKGNPKMNLKNLNQINSELQNKGYLLKDKYKKGVRHLNKSLKNIKDYIENNEPPYVIMMKFSN